jgi:hypothetical protein
MGSVGLRIFLICTCVVVECLIVSNMQMPFSRSLPSIFQQGKLLSIFKRDLITEKSRRKPTLEKIGTVKTRGND